MIIGSDIEKDVHLFHQGANYHSYDLLGCHFTYDKSKELYNYVFRVWAPRAYEVRVVGDFSSWTDGILMRKISDGIWESKFADRKNFEGTYYKFLVRSKSGVCLKSDPYAFASQTLTETASIIKNIDRIKFHDSQWMKKRRKLFAENPKCTKGHFYSAPMNIYEMHLGSWRTRDRVSTEDGRHYLNYREIASELAPYLKMMGYTHAELLPIMEHPFDGSWGYQVCGYYAPTSRFGTPEDFAFFVDTLHRYGIGVILDWVPAHFPKDAHGLYEFDGEPLYEYQDRLKMEHKGWGTRCFDVGREEVRSFLISNALFWFRKYHIDGLRIDAVASMLYLDYDRKPGEWVPNSEGNNRNYVAAEFFKSLNCAVFAEFPDVLMIAEESTSWPMVTKPVNKRGLGFNFKWNMGFANDMFHYVQLDPIYRQFHHSDLTFPMMYAFSENYVLPVSHDEVVHGKKSLIDKMYGSYDEKFSMMRAYLIFMMTMPGKKLIFMGTEFAQFREWDYKNELEWFMLRYPRHCEMQRFVRTLNHFYRLYSELWDIDDSWDGFQWIEADRISDNVVIYKRTNIQGRMVIIVVNFSPVDRKNYEFEIEKAGKYGVLLNSDDYSFGGKNVLNKRILKTEYIKYVQNERVVKKRILRFDLPAYTGIILKKVPYKYTDDSQMKNLTDKFNFNKVF